MEYDFAIVYFGLTRSTKKVYDSHIKNVYNVLDKHNLTYKKFMHTWKTKDNTQRVWNKIIPQEIDYSEYKLLNPDFYKIDNQEDFITTVNIDDFYYKHHANNEWIPELIMNHICALESMKRSLEMVEDYMNNGNSQFKYIMFIRPDVICNNELPLHQIIPNEDKINIPNNSHYEGYNDRFAIMNYKNACFYGKRINELAEFRKRNGRIVSEKYVKFIINKYNLKINEINFNFDIIRP